VLPVSLSAPGVDSAEEKMQSDIHSPHENKKNSPRFVETVQLPIL
jgi:hypothetical protein